MVLIPPCPCVICISFILLKNTQHKFCFFGSYMQLQLFLVAAKFVLIISENVLVGICFLVYLVPPCPRPPHLTARNQKESGSILVSQLRLRWLPDWVIVETWESPVNHLWLLNENVNSFSNPLSVGLRPLLSSHFWMFCDYTKCTGIISLFSRYSKLLK